jgi:hypothetical protein
MLNHECTGWALDGEVAAAIRITGGKPTYED